MSVEDFFLFPFVECFSFFNVSFFENNVIFCVRRICNVIILKVMRLIKTKTTMNPL